jgi:large subunit ribosomal protein L35Ae
VNILAQILHGRITNYRIGIRTQASRECLIEFETVTSSSLACQLVGQKVTWKNGSKKMIGQVMGPHGRNGMVKVRFVHGVPGQAIGTKVQLTR